MVAFVRILTLISKNNYYTGSNPGPIKAFIIKHPRFQWVIQILCIDLFFLCLFLVILAAPDAQSLTSLHCLSWWSHLTYRSSCSVPYEIVIKTLCFAAVLIISKVPDKVFMILCFYSRMCLQMCHCFNYTSVFSV